MSRPHEDRQRHTLVDHRPGGAPTVLPNGTWVAIGIAHVKAERTDACVAAYETLIERAQRSNVHANPGLVFASDDGRRVVVIAGLGGREGFEHLAAAWDDHHRFAQHRVIAESVSFALYKVIAGIREANIDPTSSDAYVFEHVERLVTDTPELATELAKSLDFRGATVFHAADERATVLLSRLGHSAAYDRFRNTLASVNILGSATASGATHVAIHPRKTIANV